MKLPSLRSPGNPALFWWLGFAIQAVLLVFAFAYSLPERLWHADVTHLSWLMLAVYAISSAWVGVKTIREQPERAETFWFISDLMLAVGMLGTMIGFVIMLNSTFSGFDLSNPEAAKQVIAGMGVGMATANWTTIVGLITSILLKIQLVNLERLLDE